MKKAIYPPMPLIKLVSKSFKKGYIFKFLHHPRKIPRDATGTYTIMVLLVSKNKNLKLVFKWTGKVKNLCFIKSTLVKMK